jgi:endonuclease/exonuclease/phosphatase family metal-dependent hydrolase
VGTVHLESLDTERTRAAQLRQISAVEGLDVLCGDFNFDDVFTWGEWRQPGRKRPVSALENNVLACVEIDQLVCRVLSSGEEPTSPRSEQASRRWRILISTQVLARALPDFVDAWSTVFPNNRGLTFDGATNPWVRDSGERMRYDRVMVRRSLGRPVAAERLGTTPAGDGLFASDHFGLRVDVVML